MALHPDGPSTQYLRTPVPIAIKARFVFGPETLNIGYLDPLG